MDQYLLGIDVGTTGTKTLLFTKSGKLLAHAYRGYKNLMPQVGWSEQNAQDWWNAVVDTVKEVCTTQEICENVAAISLSLQGGTVIPTDANGNPLCNAVVWNDHRCHEEMQEFIEEFNGDAYMYRTTGWTLGENLPALTIRWFRKNKPEIFEKAAYFLTVPDYISMKMTGIPAVDISDAGINQLCDIEKRRYDAAILNFCGISEEQLPKLVLSGDIIGNLTATAAKELGLTEKTVLVAGAHDQYAVALGAGAVKSGDILIGSGTCWVVTAISDKVDFDSGLAQSVPAVPGLWGSLESLSSGGNCLEWLRKNVAFEDGMDYDTINHEVACRKASENGLFFYPFEGKSGENSYFTKASFIGLDMSHDRMDMARAVMEGVVFQAIWLMEDFAAKPGKDGIILAGGASKSPVWAQLLADISGLTVRIPEIADLACVGAAIMAGVGCGLYPSMKEGYCSFAVKERIVQPDLEKTALYKVLYDKYKRNAKRLKTLLENIE